MTQQKLSKSVKYPWIHLSYETQCLDKTDKICNVKTIAGVIRIMQIFLSEVWTLMYRSTIITVCDYMLAWQHTDTQTCQHTDPQI